jgi:hypothetical protein
MPPVDLTNKDLNKNKGFKGKVVKILNAKANAI